MLHSQYRNRSQCKPCTHRNAPTSGSPKSPPDAKSWTPQRGEPRGRCMESWIPILRAGRKLEWLNRTSSSPFANCGSDCALGSTAMALEPELWIIVKPWPCSFYSEPVNGAAYSVNCELWNYVELTVRVIPWRLMNLARLYKVRLRLG